MNARTYIGILTALIVVGCTTTDPKTGENKTSNTAKGAGIGAVAGAVIGSAVNHDNRAQGAAIGAALGGGAGAAVGYRKDKQEAELREKLKNSSIEVQQGGDAIKVVMPGSVSFDADSAKLRPNFQDKLAKISESLNQYPDTTIFIAGHTDNKGPEPFNKKLSLDRANSVATYLVAQGIDSKRIKTAGFGSSVPIGDNATNMGRAKNRRVEIKIVAPAPATASSN